MIWFATYKIIAAELEVVAPIINHRAVTGRNPPETVTRVPGTLTVHTSTS